MHQADRGRAVTDGGGNPLDRAVAGVAHGENPGDGGLERERRAVERPARRVRPVPHHVAPGQDVTPAELDRSGQPPRTGFAADQHEQRRRRDLLGPAVPPVVQGEGFEAAGPVAVGDLGVQAHRDVGGGPDLADQVVRHRPREVVPAHQQRHVAGMTRQGQRGLAGRVPASHHEDVPARHRLQFAPGGAVEDAGADQRLERRYAETAPGDAGGDDDRLGGDLLAAGEAHDVLPVPALQADRVLGEHHVRAEHPGLLAGPAGELIAADPVREAGVVPDHRAASRLAAGNGLLQHDRQQALGRGVDGGGEAGRPGPHDGDVTFADIVGNAPAGGRDDLGARRFNHRVAVVADHHRQP